MNKVFPFAKIAGICFPIIMVFQIIVGIFRLNNLVIGFSVNFLVDALWIVFFALLICASSKHSPVVLPSWIAIGSFAIGLVSLGLSNYVTSLILKGTDDLEVMSKLSTVSNVLNYVCLIAGVTAFIWLSIYFPKKSVLKATCIIIAIVMILIRVYYLTFHAWKIEDDSTRNMILTGLSVFWSLAVYIPYSVFCLSFSKLKKS